MSTPSVSTLPNPLHNNYNYPHHRDYQPHNGYGASNSSLLHGGSRLGYNYSTPSSNNGTNSVESSRPSQNPAHTARIEVKSTAMPVSSASIIHPNSKKRQRSRDVKEPDWEKFYANGLPKEVIVIDDSPEPSSSVVSNTQASSRIVVGSDNRHAAKKRRRDDVGAAYDPVYHLGPSQSNNHSPEYKDSSGSTISTDRTTSAIHTTAATSLGSHSSNGNGYENADVQAGQKRKRQGTRLQLANEAKRKELEINGDAFSNYQPPPKPPIKAADVQVKAVADVRHSVIDEGING